MLAASIQRRPGSASWAIRPGKGRKGFQIGTYPHLHVHTSWTHVHACTRTHTANELQHVEKSKTRKPGTPKTYTLMYTLAMGKQK